MGVKLEDETGEEGKDTGGSESPFALPQPCLVWAPLLLTELRTELWT